MSEYDDSTILIGLPGGDHLAIYDLSWPNDEDWRMASVSANSPPFSGSFTLSIRSDEVKALRDVLLALKSDCTKPQSWKTMEQQIALEFQGNVRGAISIDAKVSDDIICRRFDYVIGMDQSYLDGIIAKISQNI
jgi:hypothetical protein